MAYVGNPIDTQNTFQSLVGKRFNGDGSTTAFTLDVAPSSTLDIEVFVGNVRQDPNSAYTLSGTTLTFTGAPPSGTNNIYVVHQAKSVGTIDVPTGGVQPDSLASNVISGQTLVTLDNSADHVLINDATDGALKKALIPAASFAGIDDQTSSNDDQLTITDTAVVINEDSDDVDFRVESNGNTNMLLVDAGNDRVKVGADTGIGQLNISGSGSTTMTSSFYSDSHADISGNPCIEIHNSDTTDNNFSSIVFVESSGSANGAISCVNGNPGGNGGGELVFLTRNSGDSSDTLTHNGRMFNDGDFVIGSQNNDPDGTKGAYIDYSGFFVAHQDTSNANPLLFRGISNHGGTEEPKVEMTADGSFKSRNNNYTSFSDERIKKNITDAKSQWDDIKSINFKNFKFKTEDGSSGATLLGVIAQDLEKTSPNLVESTDPSIADIIRSSEFGEVEDDINRPKTYENPDELPSGKKVGDLVLDGSGNKIYKKKIKSLTGEKVKVVKYSVLYLKAVKALQEAMTRIETLEAKVKALEEA